ncbi:hypothetical protein [Microbacterium sp. ZW T5_56]|uniref:hypothetical protein n=1 Tax=Microbacterium sp. ZW T5_56 TaxID=3378081 RepID=UPI003852DAF7
MVTLLLDSANLEISLSVTERAAAFAPSSTIRLARTDITRVQLTDDPWTWLRGVRKPGTQIPGVIAAGTWHSTAGTDFVVVRGRREGVVIELTEDAPYQRLLLTTRHGLALVNALRLDASEQLEEVSEMVAHAAPQAPRKRSPKGATRPATA